MMLFQETFLSVWYWVFAVLFWGVICNYTFGIPNELLMRSKRSAEESEIFDRYARRNLAMFGRAIKKRTLVVTGITAFVLTLVGTLAVVNRAEAAMGIIVIIAPMAARWMWGGYMIRKLNENMPDPERLRRIFMFERRVTGIVAGLSITAAYLVATLHHGPGWSEVLFRGY
ncbi:MAG: hypothetical protein AAF367_02890 [Pseudomonadota bacterium]